MRRNLIANISNRNRLYTRFIIILKVIQYASYFTIAYCLAAYFIVLHKLLLEFRESDESEVKITLEMLGWGTISTSTSGATWKIITWGVFAVVTMYIITQSLIAIVDLLSRLEHNTRIEK